MANEITHNLNSYGVKSGQTVKAVYSETVTLAGNALESKPVTINTTVTNITIPAGTKVAIIKNIGPTNFMNILESDGTTVLQKLVVNDWTFLRPPAAGQTIKAQADTAGVEATLTLFGT